MRTIKIRTPFGARGAITFAALLMALFSACSSGDEPEGAFVDTYDTYFESFSSDYNVAPNIASLAEGSAVAVTAELVDVEDGRYFGEAEGKPEGVHLNLVFRDREDTVYYVQIPRPMDSDVDQLKKVLPIGSTSVIYLIPNTDPLDEGWFNAKNDGTEWFFTTPQGWILDHPERGVVWPLEDDTSSPPFPDQAETSERVSIDEWLVDLPGS